MAKRVVIPGEGGGLPVLVRIALIVVPILLILFFFVGQCVTRVDAGHVGVRVALAGSTRGVQNMPTVQGWVFYNPISEQIVVFPTAVVNIVWTKSATEGRPIDESITFASREGANINADIGIAFHIDPGKAPSLYARFHETNLEQLGNTFIRNEVRSAFTSVASTMKIEEIYGSKRNALTDQVLKEVSRVLNGEGIVVDQLTINGTLRLPEDIVAGINRALEADQNAKQAENKVRQVSAEAAQRLVSAEASASAARFQAQGEADAIRIRAAAEADANAIIRASANALVLAYRQLEKWDGKLPMYAGSALPMMTIDVSKVPEMSEGERRRVIEETIERRIASAPTATPSASANPAPAPAPVVAPRPAPLPPPSN